MARPIEKNAKNLGYTSITIRLDYETINRLNAYCEKEGVVRSEFIRKLIIQSIQS